MTSLHEALASINKSLVFYNQWAGRRSWNSFYLASLNQQLDILGSFIRDPRLVKRSWLGALCLMTYILSNDAHLKALAHAWVCSIQLWTRLASASTAVVMAAVTTRLASATAQSATLEVIVSCQGQGHSRQQVSSWVFIFYRDKTKINNNTKNNQKI